MNRESSHGIKEFFNRHVHVPPLVLKARYLVALPFAEIRLPEQEIGWLPLGLGLVAEDKPTENLLSFRVHAHTHQLTQVSLCSSLLEFHIDLECSAEGAINAQYTLLQVAVCEYGVYLLRGQVLE